MNTRILFKYFPLLVFIAFSIFCWFVSKSYAANYSFYFNNVEQGANSQASPSLNVPGDAQTQPAVKQEKVQIKSNLPQVQSPEVPGVIGVQRRTLRLGLLAQAISIQAKLKNPALGGTLLATFFPIRELGMSLFGNLSARGISVLGAELEIIPISVSLFDLRNFLDIAVLLGGSSLHQTEYTPFLRLHGGLRAFINLSERFGITASARTNITDRKDLTYTMADAGITLRL